MAKLIYEFINNVGTITTVDIKLLDTPFVNQWRTYMHELYARVPNVIWYVVCLNRNDRWLTPSQLTPYFARLHAAFNFFHKKKIENFSQELDRLEYLLNNPHECNQHDLNVWHRHFTRLDATYSMKPDMTPPNTHIMDMFTYIQDINQWVHKCEGYTYYDCERRKILTNPAQYSVQFTNANNISFLAENDNKNVWDTSTASLKAGFYDCYTESYDHTVWLNEDIIGKDQIKAWLDGDDLSMFDVTGNDVMTPNIMFDPNKLFPKTIENPDFKKEYMMSGKTLDRPPLGDITNLESIDWELILNSRLHKIVLDDKTLWNYT